MALPSLLSSSLQSPLPEIVQPISARPWSDLLKSKPASAGSVELVYQEPVFINGVLQIEDELLQEGENEWRDAVVGFFLDRRWSFEVVKKHVERRWKLKGTLNMGLSNEIFYFRFNSEEDRKSALDVGSFVMRDKMFIVRPWSKSMEEGKCQIHRLPIWVKIYNIPTRLWNAKGIAKIASALGKPLFLDKRTEGKDYLSYGKVCVEIEPKKELPEQIPVRIDEGKSVKVFFEYDWKPYICVHCNTFGHTTAGCQKKNPVQIHRREIDARPPTQDRQQSYQQQAQGNGNNAQQWQNVGNQEFVQGYQLRGGRNQGRNTNSRYVQVQKGTSTSLSLNNSFGALPTEGLPIEEMSIDGNPETDITTEKLNEILDRENRLEEGEFLPALGVVGTIENESATSTHIEPQQPSIQPDMPTLSTPSPGTATTSPIITEPPSTTIETPAPPLQPLILLPPTTHISKGESEAVRIRKRWEERQKQHAKEIEEEVARKGKESTKAGKQKGKGKQEKSRSEKLSIMEDVEEHVSKDEIEDGDLLKNYLMKGI